MTGFVEAADLAALAAVRFTPQRVAAVWRRTLNGDFAAVARQLAPPSGIVDVTPAQVRRVAGGPAVRRAVDQLLADLAALDALGQDPVLSCVVDYPRDTRPLPFPVDVYGFHVDRAPSPVDTWLCTYAGAGTELLAPRAARRRIDDVAVASRLREVAGDVDIDTFIAAGSFDLHYEAIDGAEPHVCVPGELWRLAVRSPRRARAAVHRAPAGGPPRLLLIA